MLSSGAASRIKTVGEGWDQGAGQQVVVKHTGSPAKSGRAIGQLVDYIACAYASSSRPRLALNVFDEFGQEVDFEKRREPLKGWTILSEEDNRRPGRTGNSPDDLLRYQAHHLIWSFDAKEAGIPEGDAAAVMSAIAREFIFQEFGMAGRPVLWTMHRDKPGRPHVHMVVSGFDDEGRALGLDKTRRRLDDFCAELARLGRAYGLPLVFSRREDREKTRRAVYQGIEPLRNDRRRVTYERKTDLWERAPLWWQEHSRDLVKRQTEGHAIAPAGKSYRPFGDGIDAFAQLLTETYQHPRRAAESLLLMAAGKGNRDEKALAIWYFIHRPEFFGTMIENHPDRVRRTQISKLLKKRRAWPVPPRSGGKDARSSFVAIRRARRQSNDIHLISRSLREIGQLAEDHAINPVTVNTIRLSALEATEVAESLNGASRGKTRRSWRSFLPSTGLATRKRDKS